MKKIYTILALWCAVTATMGQNALKVEEYKLDNGLTVWINEDHSQPKVFGAVVVKAGAADCPDTGLAHYFEHILFKGTSSAYVGELCNFLLGSVFCLAAGFIYQLKKSRKSALIGSLVGAALMALVSVPLNYFVVYPAYVVCYGLPLEAIIGMYQAILPSADNLIKCLTIFNMPFTFCKGMLDVLLCFLIDKPLSPLLHK